VASRGAIQAAEAFIQLSIQGQNDVFRKMSGLLKKTARRAPGTGAAAKIGAIAGVVGALTTALINFATGLASAALNLAMKAVGLLTTGIMKAIDAASRAETAYNRLKLVFKENADEAVKFSNMLASSVGRTRTQIDSSLATFKTLFTGLDFGEKAAVSFSKGMTQLTLDLAAFVGANDESTMRRFVAALAGSPETLDQYGINLKEAALSAELVARGLPKVTDGANEAEKTIARLVIILKAMKSQGALNAVLNLSKTFNQASQRLKSAIQTLAADLGDKLLGKAGETLDEITKIVELINSWVNSNWDMIKQFLTINGLLKEAGSWIGEAVDANDIGLAFELGFAFAKKAALNFGIFLQKTIEKAFLGAMKLALKPFDPNFSLNGKGASGSEFGVMHQQFAVHREIKRLTSGLRERAEQGRMNRERFEQGRRDELAANAAKMAADVEEQAKQQKLIRAMEEERKAREKAAKEKKKEAERAKEARMRIAEEEIRRSRDEGRLPSALRVITEVNLKKAVERAAMQLERFGAVSPRLLRAIDNMRNFLRPEQLMQLMSGGGEAFTSGFAAQLAGNSTTANHISVIAQESKKHTRLLRGVQNSGGIKVV
jgi:hypothetical protein